MAEILGPSSRISGFSLNFRKAPKLNKKKLKTHLHPRGIPRRANFSQRRKIKKMATEQQIVKTIYVYQPYFLEYRYFLFIKLFCFISVDIFKKSLREERSPASFTLWPS